MRPFMKIVSTVAIAGKIETVTKPQNSEMGPKINTTLMQNGIECQRYQ